MFCMYTYNATYRVQCSVPRAMQRATFPSGSFKLFFGITIDSIQNTVVAVFLGVTVEYKIQFFFFNNIFLVPIHQHMNLRGSNRLQSWKTDQKSLKRHNVEIHSRWTGPPNSCLVLTQPPLSLQATLHCKYNITPIGQKQKGTVFMLSFDHCAGSGL